MEAKVALVTGASKGLGFAIVKALCEKFNGIVYLTARNEIRGMEAVKKLNDLGYYPELFKLDVTEEESLQAVAKHLQEKHGGLDILVNNAVILEWDEVYPSYEAAKRNVNTNFFSLLKIEHYLFPLLRDGARVINISSSCGHLSNLKNRKWIDILSKQDLTTEEIVDFVNEYLESVKNGTFNKSDFADDGKHAEHRVSKIALTALSIVQQRKYKNFSINAVHPGLLKTESAHGKGIIDVDDAAKLVLYLALDASPNLKGVFMWSDRKLMDWRDVEGDYYCKGLW